MYTLILIGVSMIVSLMIIPVVIAVSKKLDIVDKPNFRKIHTKPISMLGGSAILLSFLIGIWLGEPIEREIKPLLLGSVVIYLVGFD
ncbi:glycoside hydrolase family protein [Staphylococcus schleiferi]|uniref:Glycoside hydrolase family protein n=1 Tax=Staphylococcus schleiferi TaxID=1295 RepID=A0A7Z7QQV2_STASC|nr:glycoside hydrolase family protein [Staphylococcus schleiferi]SUM89986.1 glycoside hydrolase family protein [Staphylococcus schleiferi]